MNPKPATIFISDQEDKESYEDLDANISQNSDDSDPNPHNILDDDLDHLLDGEDDPAEQTMLRFKVTQLQKICNSLTSTNQRLIDRVSTLEEQKEKQKKEEIFMDQYSELNCQFSEVEELITEYKTSLDSFQKNVHTDLKEKDSAIEKLKSQLQELADQNNDLVREKQSIEKLSKQLESRNEQLIRDMEELERQKSELQQKTNSVRLNHQPPYRYRNYESSFIDEQISTEVQSEYEHLIDRLVDELEYQRTMKKKMNEQIKRLSVELNNTQKQIMEKNRKIYELELKILRNSRETGESSMRRVRPRSEEQKFDTRPNSKVQTKNRNMFSSFPLIELINGELQNQISCSSRKIIGLKVAQFYERKLAKQDYSNVMTENLLVTNYIARRPELVVIRKTGTSVYEDGEQTQKSLIWNMAFILDNLFRQADKAEDFDQILDLTGQMLQKQIANNRQSLDLIKSLLKQ